MDKHTRDPNVAPPFGNPAGWDDGLRMWEHTTLRRTVEHGVRLFNADGFYESRDYFGDEWYNYGAGAAESAFLHGIVQVTADMYKHFDFENDVGMWPLFEMALEYLSGVPSDFYGVGVDNMRATLRAALDGPTTLHDWQIALDGHRVTAYPADYSYIEGLDR